MLWPNLVSMFYEQADRLADRPFLWTKADGRYQPLCWGEVRDRISRLATGLQMQGIAPGDRVVLVSENRPEWLIADFAIMAAGGVTVPAYITNTEADHAYVLAHCGARAVIVSTARLAKTVLQAAAHATDLALCIAIEPPARAQQTGPLVLSWAEALAPLSAPLTNVLQRMNQITRLDLACLIYTSGTGGAPKGVMLHHGAILHNVSGAARVLADLGGTPSEEVFLSLLPLSHAYEHTIGQFLPVAIGAQICYAEGLERVMSNFVEARPTVVSAVPRFYELIHQRIRQSARKAGKMQQRLIEAAMALGRRRYQEADRFSLLDHLADRALDVLVRRPIRARFGGRLRAMVSGGAPLSIDVSTALRGLGLPVVQGYGQTEAGPLISVNHPRRIKLHTVGPPIPGVEARIADDGEILVRGEMVMQGYWRNEQATREVLRDGWLHTGDVGEIDADGDIRITDRKKDIIVNSGGDNLSPARIEGLLTLRPEIMQAMVYGDRRPHLVALLVPDPEWLRRWLHETGKASDPETLPADPDLLRHLSGAVDQVNAQLSVVERVRRFLVVLQPFSVENGQLTPTLKIRRHAILRVFGAALDRLYE
jgi:long-chain acyl-CoA synthetase